MRPGSRRMAIEFATAIASSPFRFWRGCTTNAGWSHGRLKRRKISGARNIIADDSRPSWTRVSVGSSSSESEKRDKAETRRNRRQKSSLSKRFADGQKKTRVAVKEAFRCRIRTLVNKTRCRKGHRTCFPRAFGDSGTHLTTTSARKDDNNRRSGLCVDSRESFLWLWPPRCDTTGSATTYRKESPR